MRPAIEKVMRRYGLQMTLARPEETCVFRGIFQHTGSKDWHNMEKAYSLLGQIPRGQYLVLAPVGVTLVMGDRLVVGERRFSIRRVETDTWRGKPMYSWGLCVELGEEDTWPI
jgi:hypothetical protein